MYCAGFGMEYGRGWLSGGASESVESVWGGMEEVVEEDMLSEDGLVGCGELSTDMRNRAGNGKL